MSRKWEMISNGTLSQESLKSKLASVFREGDEAIKALEKKVKELEKKLSEMQD